MQTESCVNFKLLITLIVTIFLTSCSSTPQVEDKPSLVGVWSLKYDGNGEYWFSQIAFTENGKKCVLSYNFDPSGNVAMDYYLNDYEIVDGVLITKVVFSSTPYLPPGYIIRDRIDHIDKSTLDLFMIEPEGSVLEQHQKLQGVKPNSICQVVRNFAYNKRIK